MLQQSWSFFPPSSPCDARVCWQQWFLVTFALSTRSRDAVGALCVIVSGRLVMFSQTLTEWESRVCSWMCNSVYVLCFFCVFSAYTTCVRVCVYRGGSSTGSLVSRCRHPPDWLCNRRLYVRAKSSKLSKCLQTNPPVPIYFLSDTH